MKTFRVKYTQSNDLEIEVQAKDQNQAKNKADEILNKKTFEELINDSQRGYWEHWETEEDEKDDRNN